MRPVKLRFSPRLVGLALSSVLVVVGALVVQLAAPSAPQIAEARQTALGARAAAAPPQFERKWGSKGTGNGQFDSPVYLATDAEGNVYVADRGVISRIQKFDKNGVYQSGWGTFGAAGGEFNAPTGIAVSPRIQPTDEQKVYVADSLNSRLQIFRTDGSFVAATGNRGSGDGQFFIPEGVAVGPLGDVYVVDSVNHRVQVFDPSGSYRSQWGSRGTGNGQFDDPMGVAVDSKGDVYVTDHSTANASVQKFSANGHFLGKWTAFGSDSDSRFTPSGVAVGAADTVYVAASTRVLEFTAEGQPLAQWSTRVESDAYGPNTLGIAVTPTGHIYVTDANNVCVKKYRQPTDQVPPTTTVEGADGWHRRRFILKFVSTDAGGSGIDYVEARHDFPLLPIWEPWEKLDPVSHTVDFSRVTAAGEYEADDGEYEFEYRAADRAGNVEEAKQVTVLVDTTRPKVTLVAGAMDQDGRAVITATRGKKSVIKFRVQEALSPQIRFEGKIYDAKKTVKMHSTSSWLRRKSVHSWSFVCRLDPGRYTVSIEAHDRAGNISNPAVASLKVVK